MNEAKEGPALRIMLVAGEASGDKHGASLVRALKGVSPGTRFEFFGSGGEEMRGEGVDTLVDARDVAIMGIPEIIRAFGRLYGAYRKLILAARERRPDVVVLIDWPDFNMRVARRLRRDGFRIIYYISPQIWAWRRYRVRAIRRDVDRMLVILPFEEEFYKSESVEVEYVGHPLAEAVRVSSTREEFARRHGLDIARPIIALLPGSRHKEIHYHLPELLDAAKRLSRAGFKVGAGARVPSHEVSGRSQDFSGSIPSLHAPQFVVPLASTVDRAQVERIMSEARLSGGASPDVTLVEHDLYDALGHAEVAVVASGTATVEAALVGTPMVIIYKGSEINWRLIRPLIHLDTFGMANLIAGRRIVPELMQKDVTGEKIAREVEAILSDPARLSRMREDLAEVRARLTRAEGRGPERAARAVLRMIGGGGDA
ncbi:MAG TPA: lipid-A-disaccharide synthase [Blastocatellia bacterium]|nr:lipid-A-disaccharide synthase [Blastocatellia bacterium]